MIPEVPRPHRHGSDGRREIRRGLLYMLLAAGIYYFAGGDSAIKLPVTIVPAVTPYPSPLLFFCGVGFSFFRFRFWFWVGVFLLCLFRFAGLYSPAPCFF